MPPEPALDPLVFSTGQFPPRDQFTAWQAQMAPLVDVSLPQGRAPADGFSAEQTIWNLGSILVVQQTTSAHSYVRSAAKLRSSPIDHWCVALPQTGRTWTEADGKVAANQPGSVELRSLAYPFRGRTTDSRTRLIIMARDLFAEQAAVLDANNNAILSGNLARLMSDYVDSIETRLPRLDAADLPNVVRTFRDVVLGCLSSSGEAPEYRTGAALMERARRHIQRNIASPDLTPDALARALGVSRTSLYHLFESSGGVLHYIRRRRLSIAHAALADPADTRRIGEIAEALGFASAAGFSRAFHDEFGYSPREARSRDSPAIGQVPAASKSERSFEIWLSSLSA